MYLARIQTDMRNLLPSKSSCSASPLRFPRLVLVAVVLYCELRHRDQHLPRSSDRFPIGLWTHTRGHGREAGLVIVDETSCWLIDGAVATSNVSLGSTRELIGKQIRLNWPVRFIHARRSRFGRVCCHDNSDLAHAAM